MNLLKPLIRQIQKLMPKMEKFGQMGSDVYAIKAVAWSSHDSYECLVVGNKEVDVTAYVATEIAKIDAHEIATLFNIKKAVVESNLRTLLRSNVLWMETFTKEIVENISGKQCRIELFNLEIIIALSFRIDKVGIHSIINIRIIN